MDAREEKKLTSNIPSNDQVTAGRKQSRSSTFIVKLLFSLFCVWHVLVLVIGPAPGSYSMAKVWPYFRPYLKVFHLENYWAFFAPNPSSGVLFRYILQDDEGNITWFKFTEAMRKSDPNFLRHTSLQNDLENESPWFRHAFADWLSRRHADLNPRYVQYLFCYQKPIYRDDWMKGHRPLDDDFMTFRYSEVITLPVDFQGGNQEESAP